MTMDATRLEWPDGEILREIRSRLDWQTFYELRVMVIEGVVTVDGKVDSWTERRTIGAILSSVPGVRGVVNVLAVRPAPLREPTLRMSIEHALELRATRGARRLEVSVGVGGRVTVVGTVGSHGERAAVLGAIVGTLGVVSVDDQLRIAAPDA
jgi:osmotically-inducible protein OsmY